MTQAPETERYWWDGLQGDEILHNTAGNPPYDVHAVGTTVMAHLRPRHSMARILDLGCGAGRLTNILAHGYPDMEFTGVDIAPSLLAVAARGCRTNVVFRPCDGRRLPEALGLLDGAYSITMFQHIPLDAQRDYIAQVADHLRPTARFVFNVALGHEDCFLSHQVPEWSTVFDWVEDAGMENVTSFDQFGWSWFVAEKGT